MSAREAGHALSETERLVPEGDAWPMFLLLIVFVSRTYAFLQQTMPTNILIRATHTRAATSS